MREGRIVRGAGRDERRERRPRGRGRGRNGDRMDGDDNAGGAATLAGPMADAARPPRFDPARRRAVTFALVLVTSLSSFESTVVTTAMPTIIGDLHGLPLYSWVFSVYLLGSTITMPVYGRLADVHGRRKMLLLAIALFVGELAPLRARADDAAAHRRARPPGPRRGRPHPARAHRLGRPLLDGGARADPGALQLDLGSLEPRRPARGRVPDDDRSAGARSSS